MGEIAGAHSVKNRQDFLLLEVLPVALTDFDLACQDFLIIFVVFLKKFRCIQLVRTFFHAFVAVETSFDFFHIFLPGLIEPAVGLYLEGFALGGILRFLKMLDPFGGTHIWLAEGISAVILLILEGFLRSRRKKASLSKEAMLYCGVRRIQVHAWYDTGNGLYDPFNGKPVSILEQSCMEQLLAGREQERIPRKIPYRTIDREGVLDVYILDAMEIGGPEEQIRIERPEVACMPEKIGSCQLLLHRDLLPS